MKTNQKECTKCGQILPIALFPKNKRTCKKCVNKRKKEIYNPEAIKKHRETQKKKNLVRMRCNAARHNWKRRSDSPIPDLNLLEMSVREQLSLGCFYTKKELTEETFGLDHKVPLKRGGSNDISNIVVVDQKINKAKGDLLDSEFISLLNLISTWEDKGESFLTRLRASNIIFK
jgi:5-methylcytosine-specific restriction endonuclease McrA